MPVDGKVLPFLPPDPPHCVRGEETCRAKRILPPHEVHEVRGAGGEKLRHLPLQTEQGHYFSNLLGESKS